MKRLRGKKEKTKRKRLKVAFLCFGFAFLLIVGYGGYHFFWSHQPKLDSNKKKPVTVADRNTSEVDPKIEEMKSLYQENNDLYGWIKIENTKIDYPVMYTKGEDYYLYRDFYKQDFKAGSIYIDKHNNISPRDVNLLIHGHSMKDGSMFRALLEYEDISYYKKHPMITFYTTEEKQNYEIIAVFKSKVYNVNDKVFKYYKFYGKKTEAEYNNYIDNIKRLSLYPIEATATYPDELITLSTCEYSQENGRMVIVARKK